MHLGAYTPGRNPQEEEESDRCVHVDVVYFAIIPAEMTCPVPTVTPALTDSFWSFAASLIPRDLPICYQKHQDE